MSEHDRIRHLEMRISSMNEEYDQWEPHWRQLRDAIQPTRGRFSLGENRKSSTINTKIIDSTAKKSLDVLTSGLQAGMTSPSRPWFRLGIQGIDDTDDPEINSYLHVSQNRMYAVMRASNVYRMFPNCYRDLGLYGNFGGLIVPNFNTVVHAHAFPIGLYRLGIDADGDANAIHREVKIQCKSAF